MGKIGTDAVAHRRDRLVHHSIRSIPHRTRVRVPRLDGYSLMGQHSAKITDHQHHHVYSWMGGNGRIKLTYATRLRSDGRGRGRLHPSSCDLPLKRDKGNLRP